ncbi:hypothetical protein RJ639_044002 [Escallonia herrerae]|uniref:Integrase catalytic domain-containing protein n=1 Tax=Escallonia herrerae TaxID=1293975 RepID=A0AA89B7M6_9ASTE|nr:hypothetical protein RJ639_044002 [Escallonia herrerae]
MAEEGKGKIEKFNSINFQWWKMQVEDYLYQKNLYLPLVGEKLEVMNANEWAILDRKALAIVRLSLIPQVAFNIFKEKTTAFVMDCFCDYVHGDFGHVIVENRYRCNIVGKEKVEIKLSNRGTLVLKDVRHIPELQKNLISISGLDCECYFVTFGEKQWKVIKGSMVVARGERVGTIYILSGTHNHSISLAFTENQRATLWHHRLGHLSESDMRILHSKNVLPGIKNIQLDFFEGCVYRKQKRVSFPRDGKEKKIERLELVHMDVCRPITVKFLEGNFYFISFIDDDSRKTWIYAIRQKSEVYHTFKKWKALVENETENKVKCLKSDNGGEYRNGGFQEHCFNNGIGLIRTVKRIPQENGLVEGMNRTIMERGRCMRIHVDLPLQFWATAVDTTVYLINRSPASALNGGIPEKEWSVGGTVVSWISKLQKIVALSTIEADYVVVTEAIKEIIWLQKLLTVLGYGQVDCKLWTDRQLVIHLAKNSVFHSRTKHIQLRYHFIQSLLKDEQLNLEKIEGNKNLADMLMKVVDRQKLSLCSTLISIR